MWKLSRLLLYSSRESFSSMRMLDPAANDFKLLRGITSLAGMSTAEPRGENMFGTKGSRSSFSKIVQAYCLQLQRRYFSPKPSYPSFKSSNKLSNFSTDDNDAVPSAEISRPLSDILKDLNKKVPESLVKTYTDSSGFSYRYIPWHILNRILNLHAPEWSGEVRNITHSADGNSVSVVYRVTLYGTDAEIFRESTGTASVSDTSYGRAVQKAEAMAFRRACARLGLGLHLYHEDLE